MSGFTFGPFAKQDLDFHWGYHSHNTQLQSQRRNQTHDIAERGANFEFSAPKEAHSFWNQTPTTARTKGEGPSSEPSRLGSAKRPLAATLQDMSVSHTPDARGAAPSGRAPLTPLTFLQNQSIHTMTSPLSFVESRVSSVHPKPAAKANLDTSLLSDGFTAEEKRFLNRVLESAANRRKTVSRIANFQPHPPRVTHRSLPSLPPLRPNPRAPAMHSSEETTHVGPEEQHDSASQDRFHSVDVEGNHRYVSFFVDVPRLLEAVATPKERQSLDMPAVQRLVDAECDALLADFVSHAFDEESVRVALARFCAETSWCTLFVFSRDEESHKVCDESGSQWKETMRNALRQRPWVNKAVDDSLCFMEIAPQ